MNVRALHQGVHRFVLEEIAPERWRNGGGWTRTIAAGGAAGEAIWRVSVADIAKGAAFSTFPGMNRTAVLIDGSALELVCKDDPPVLVEPGRTCSFPGEAQLHALPLNKDVGRPTRLWNVMVRRGVAKAQASLRDDIVLFPSRSVAVVMILKGQYCLTTTETNPGEVDRPLLQLVAGEGLYLEANSQPLMLLPLHPDCNMVWTDIQPA
jgi:environmental stress-induced protein Ves